MRVISQAARLGRAGVAAAACSAAVLAGASAALAAPSGPATAPFGGTSHLSAVSCPPGSSGRWCLAVGGYRTTDGTRHSLAAIWTGTGWRTLKNPPGRGLSEVACSSATFCMAEGGPAGALTWNGSSWRTIAGPAGGLPSLTCASRNLCMRIHDSVVSAWNGTSWHDAATMTSFCAGAAPGPCGLTGVSCGSAASCVTVGTWTVSQEPVQEPLAFAWNGKKWQFSQPSGAAEGNPAESNAVGCARGFCLASGSAYSEVQGGGLATASAFRAAAGTWTDVPPGLGVLCTGTLVTCDWTSQAACAGPSNCMTLGWVGFYWWNGTGWLHVPAISAGQNSRLTSVACGGSDCLAVGYRQRAGRQRTLAELWNGTSWSVLPTPK